MKSFVKNFLRVVLFLLGFVVLLLLVSFLFKPRSSNDLLDQSASSIIAEPNNTIDVLLIGDSEMYSACNPIQLWKNHGITSYCCATGGQILSYSKHFLNVAFEKQSPKVVILETNCIFRKSKITDSFYTSMSSIFPIFRYHNHWKSLSKRDFSFKSDIAISTNKGFHMDTSIISLTSTEGYMKENSKYAEFPVGNDVQVESIKDFCDNHGAKLILMSMPSTVNWNYMRHNTIEKMAEEYNIEYMDLNFKADDMNIDWIRDTRDRGDHMNFFGSQKVTKFIGEYLIDNDLVESHEGDPKYATTWDESLEKFQKICDKKEVVLE